MNKKTKKIDSAQHLLAYILKQGQNNNNHFYFGQVYYKLKFLLIKMRLNYEKIRLGSDVPSLFFYKQLLKHKSIIVKLEGDEYKILSSLTIGQWLQQANFLEKDIS